MSKISFPFSQREPVIKRGIVFSHFFNNGALTRDVSGRNYHATNFGSSFISNGTVNFNGSSNYLSFQRISSVSDFTISCWVNSTNVGFYPNGNTMFCLTSEANPIPKCILFDTNVGNFRTSIIFSDGGAFESASSSSNYCDGKWHHFVMTRSGTSLEGYVDGVKTNNLTLSSSASISFGTGNSYLGTFVNDSSKVSFMNGKLKEMCFYSVKLTLEEIKAIFNAGIPESNLVLSNCCGTEDSSINGYSFVPIGNPILGKRINLISTGNYLKRTESNWRSSDSQGTISCWIKPNVLSSYKAIFTSSDESGTNYYFGLFTDDSNRVYVIQKNNDTADTVTATTTTLSLKWHHVVLTSDGTQYKIYIDSVQQALSVSGLNSGDWFADTNLRDNAILGAWQRTSVSNYFNGEISDFKIYSESKSSDWVKNYYERTKGSY